MYLCVFFPYDNSVLPQKRSDIQRKNGNVDDFSVGEIVGCEFDVQDLNDEGLPVQTKNSFDGCILSKELANETIPDDRGTLEYTPTRGLKVNKVNYELKSLDEAIAPDQQRFGGSTSLITIPTSWLQKMKAKTRKMTPSCAIKKYIDGFFNPWELQGINSTKIDTMTGPQKEVYSALELFASEEFGVATAEFNKIINSKAGTAKRTMQLNFPERALPAKEKPRKRKESDLQND